MLSDELSAFFLPAVISNKTHLYCRMNCSTPILPSVASNKSCLCCRMNCPIISTYRKSMRKCRSLKPQITTFDLSPSVKLPAVLSTKTSFLETASVTSVKMRRTKTKDAVSSTKMHLVRQELDERKSQPVHCLTENASSASYMIAE